MVRCHGRRNWGAGRVKTAGLRYTDAIELNYLMKNDAAPRVSDQCPRCLRVSPKRRTFPDGTCVSRAACDKERAAAIADGLINEENEMSITEVRQIPAAELVAMPIKDIVGKTGIAVTDAYRMRKEAAAELNSAGASDSLRRAQIIAVVTKFGQQPDLHHPAVAPGGPIEHIPARAEPIRQDVIPTPFMAQAVVTTPKPSQEPLPQNEKPRVEPLIEKPVEKLIDKPYDIDGAVWLTNLEKDSPLIFALLERAEKRSSYEAAAKALEGVDDEMALELLGKVSMEPLEEELVKYVRASRSR